MTTQLIDQVKTLIPGIPLEIISQGAEAIVFKTSVHPYCQSPKLNNSHEFIVKYRPSKRYRHPKLDKTITKSRTVGEVKFMHKLSRVGINAPRIILVDFQTGIIWMEYSGVQSFKSRLWGVEKTGTPEDCVADDIKQVCNRVGDLIGQLHTNDMIHGDLTSSNIMLESDDNPSLIDFGLSSYSGLAEDKAVDIYVLERAIQSTHSEYADKYNEWLLDGYEKAYQGSKKYREVIGRLEEVRLRGRKRSMLG